MNISERKKHWEEVFETKDTSKVSWFQKNPETSLRLINQLSVGEKDGIIEVGSGDSYLPDYLLLEGFKDITLLDISEKALAKIKSRLSCNNKELTYVAADVSTFSVQRKFKLWHDRAVFHFLTEEKDIVNYVGNANKHLEKGAYLIVGTFSLNGPKMCSGLNVQQYSKAGLTKTFAKYFNKLECFEEIHTTPSGGNQNFIFCIFQKK